MMPKFQRITERPIITQAVQITEDTYESLLAYFPTLAMQQTAYGKRFYRMGSNGPLVPLGSWMLIPYDAFPHDSEPSYGSPFSLMENGDFRRKFVTLPDDGDVGETVHTLYHPAHVKPRVSEKGLTTTATPDTLQESSSSETHREDNTNGEGSN